VESFPMRAFKIKHTGGFPIFDRQWKELVATHPPSCPASEDGPKRIDRMADLR